MENAKDYSELVRVLLAVEPSHERRRKDKVEGTNDKKNLIEALGNKENGAAGEENDGSTSELIRWEFFSLCLFFFSICRFSSPFFTFTCLRRTKESWVENGRELVHEESGRGGRGISPSRPIPNLVHAERTIVKAKVVRESSVYAYLHARTYTSP